MTPLENAIREVVEDWITNIIGCETEFLGMVEERIVDGDGYSDVAEDFVQQYVDFDMLQASIEDAINESLDDLDIEVNVDWKRGY